MLIISQDLDEIFAIADRIVVISRGELSATFNTDQVDFEQIGLLMAGVPASATHFSGTSL